MKRYAANILSSARILFAVILLALPGIGTGFLALYSVCGMTDLFDGPIARATGSVSDAGAKLDTVGDVLTYVALAKAMLIEKLLSARTLELFLIPLGFMFFSGLLAKLRFHTFVFTHTGLSKAFGMGCFFLPFTAVFGLTPVHLTVLWAVAAAAGLEMTAIQLLINHPDPDILFLAGVKRSNRRFSEEAEDVPAAEER